jgi:membrane protein YqaA with SNARE-associated domain
VNLEKLRHWVQALIAPLGGFGILIVSFLDSSVLTFPVINELLVIDYSIQNPARWAYYAAMATVGSVLGSIFLFFLAKKSGEAFFHKHAGKRAQHIRAWLSQNAFLGVLIAALLPPPAPFKVVVIGAGVFEVRFRDFALAVVLARSVRYFGEAYLAALYGERALHFLMAHKLESTLISLGAVLGIYLVTRLVFRSMRKSSNE